jgi:hypothetical protein
MTLEQAQKIINEASTDQRLKTELVSNYANRAVCPGAGYQVRVTLRNNRIVTLRNISDWQDINMAWRGL